MAPHGERRCARVRAEPGSVASVIWLGEARGAPAQLCVVHQGRARPAGSPGRVAAYQALSYDFVLGEVIRRVTGAPVEEVLAREVLRPWGLADTSLGVTPAGASSRCVPIHGRGLSARATAHIVNRRALRRAVIRAAGISTVSDAVRTAVDRGT
jgi:CubicO group peptidase (beta-lactamase class C family)